MCFICIHADGNHFLPMCLSVVQPLYGQLKIDWQEKKLKTKRATANNEPHFFLYCSTRSGLNGCDLNRCWKSPSKYLHPEIYYTKVMPLPLLFIYVAALSFLFVCRNWWSTRRSGWIILFLRSWIFTDTAGRNIFSFTVAIHFWVGTSWIN